VEFPTSPHKKRHTKSVVRYGAPELLETYATLLVTHYTSGCMVPTGFEVARLWSSRMRIKGRSTR
jgi:hypothetical protein